MLNRAVLTGRLTRDVDLRYTQSGTAVGTFTLAVDRTFKNQQGEREADFINCVIWRKSAENFANFVRKGSLVGIDGRIQTRNYENQQGNRVYVTEIVVENFALLQSRSDREGGNNNGAYPGMAPAGSAPTTSGNPFDNPFGGSQNNGGGSNNSNNTNNNAADPFANNGDSIDISDDDLPF
ncbi:single-stranded DNA-binding protein [Lentilactobacillus senioris]|uniref:Single-stranded DNA-binding protein n=1 Tax=Lentilactobacillus senioris DSM 24302 = JCM 17472 TaxID=1423802 RepID=A0A0R2CR71_9LACO|nr:single-stranded DNA-binding protein [Lentilactobacillus senioris]KRM94318.1 single-stranded DNA binding protein (Ssb) [Lentilactobacillus senioris DSM 24302 = JCM 17472]MCY9806119.1 single-stranded DNA-binding protein [Lentilactobacillus senioris]